jgi:transportin-3
MAAPAAQVVAAINALYKSDDSAVRNEADRWLELWQASSEAWSVANAILHDPASGPEFTYFCAQTLKTKASNEGAGVLSVHSAVVVA